MYGIFRSTVIRLDPKARDGMYWLMNKPYKGWAEFGYPYRTLAELLRSWDVQLAGMGRDAYGLYIRALPRGKES